jgi:uncharacterized membrane protein YphA (DoxX/SURF4 family)
MHMENVHKPAKMINMEDSIAQARPEGATLELPAWKTVLSVISAVLLGLLFLVAGIWKIIEPFDAAARMIQAKVPAQLGLFTAIAFGVTETWAGLMLMVPRFRRWGAWISGLLLVAFMIYVGYFYEALRGEDCSCFPWIKRAVGPGFFISDAVMLLMAAAAGFWARQSESKRSAAIALGAIVVFAMSSLGIAYSRQTGTPAPDSISVNGQPHSFAAGKHFVYFFDPECGHCFQAAKAMSTYKWTTPHVIAVPTVNPQFAPQFLSDTGFSKARVSNDIEVLKKTFPFGDAPYAVAIENGRQKAALMQFEANEPEATLRKLGFVE